jgi:cytochrome c oxidase assembly factor CtaG
MTGGVQLHVLLTGAQTDYLALAAGAADIVVVAAYLAGVRRLAARGRHWPVSTTAAFITGVACIWIAVGSGLATYDDVSAPIHVVQHALLMMVAPPLLAIGKPITLAIQGSRRRPQVRIVKVVHSRTVAGLTNPPVGWTLYYGSMSACFLDRRLYDYLLDHPLAHDASHVGLLVVGYLYWQPLIGGDPSRWRLSHRGRMTSVVTGTVVEGALGMAIMTFRQPLDPINTLRDTHAAGAFFLVVAVLSCVLCATAMTKMGRRPDTPRAQLAGARAAGPQPAPGQDWGG